MYIFVVCPSCCTKYVIIISHIRYTPYVFWTYVFWTEYLKHGECFNSTTNSTDELRCERAMEGLGSISSATDFPEREHFCRWHVKTVRAKRLLNFPIADHKSWWANGRRKSVDLLTSVHLRIRVMALRCPPPLWCSDGHYYMLVTSYNKVVSK